MTMLEFHDDVIWRAYRRIMNLKNLFLVSITALGLTACPVTEVKPPSEDPGTGPTKSITITTFAPETFGKPATESNVAWLAVQDGNGAWKTVTGTVGKYAFDVTNSTGKYAFALACPVPTVPGGQPPVPSYSLELRFFTVAETTTPRVGCNLFGSINPTPPTLRTLSGTVSGVAATEDVSGQIYDPTFTVATSPLPLSVDAKGKFTTKVPDGTYTIMLTKRDKPTPPSALTTGSYSGIILERGVQVTADKIINFDFDTQSFKPVQKSIGVEGLGINESLTVTGGVALDGYPITLVYKDQKAGTVTLPTSFDAFPEDKLTANDAFQVGISSSKMIKLDRKARGVGVIKRNLPTSVALPGEFEITGKLEAATPYARPTISWNKSLVGNGILGMRFYETVTKPNTSATGTRSWNISFSSGWVGAVKSFTIPDFSALTDWNADWGFKTYEDIGWFAQFVESQLTLQQGLAVFAGDSQASKDLAPSEFAKVFRDLNASFWSYSHAAADKTAPQIYATEPPLAEPGQFVSTVPSTTPSIVIRFSESMDKASVEAAYASANLPAANLNFVWSDLFSTPDATLTITPKVALAVGTTYSFTIGTGAKDISGNAMAAARSFGFKTP
jgi:Bacterial Ig-like domain